MLTAFHGNKVCHEIQLLEGVEPHVKEGFATIVQDFMTDLFEIAELDNAEFAEELSKNSEFFNSVREAAKTGK